MDLEINKIKTKIANIIVKDNYFLLYDIIKKEIDLAIDISIKKFNNECKILKLNNEHNNVIVFVLEDDNAIRLHLTHFINNFNIEQKKYLIKILRI